MLKLKASLMKRDNAVEFIGFCGKNVTYEAIKKNTYFSSLEKVEI